jgi:DNA-directed RNA polymerase specialized sigma24 family protein
MSTDRRSSPGHLPANSFHTTRWSIVASAGRRAGPESQAALSVLCQTYWYPLYAYMRRHVASADAAQDLTQEFFVHLLDKNVLASATPEGGRFRAFLLVSMRNFLSNERDLARAQKRGGGRPTLSLDWRDAESRLDLQPAHESTADRLFEHDWAVTLLDRVLGRLRQEFESAGKSR